MRVRFVGGPLDGQTKDVQDDLAPESTIYWPPGADLTVQDERVPGVDGVVEYLYRGDGSAEYVGGLLDQEPESPL
jgi:hypothetical protein